MSRIRPIPGQRISIRHGDRLLAVPAMHRDTPSATRVQVFELVLRRLYGEAVDLTTSVADDLDRTTVARARLASLMAQTPHASRRGLGQLAA